MALFLFLFQAFRLPTLVVKCVIVPSSWSVRGPGGQPSTSVLLWASTPDFKAACSLKEGGLCRNGFFSSKWECVIGVPVLTCPQISPAHKFTVLVFGRSQFSKRADGFVCCESSAVNTAERDCGAPLLVVCYVSAVVCPLTPRKTHFLQPKVPCLQNASFTSVARVPRS